MDDNGDSTSGFEETDGRSYQIAIMARAKSENLIVCLPTGSGKTRIAVMLLKEWAHQIRQSLDQGGKRTVFLVKTVELARQHHATIKVHVDLKIRNFCDGASISLDNRKRWKDELNKHNILIFTAQKFLDLLAHDVFSLDKVNLLIIDECHHSTGEDPYSKIIRNHYRAPVANPRILGLTASISGQKIQPNELMEIAHDLENLYQARIETGSDRDEITQHSTSVDVKHLRCDNYQTQLNSKHKTAKPVFKTIEGFIAQLDKFLKNKKTPITLQNNVPQGMEASGISSSNDCLFQCRTLDQLKAHLNNILHVGYDLGLYGLFLALQALHQHLGLRETSAVISDVEGKRLYEEILASLNDLIDGSLTALLTTQTAVVSDKVLKLEKRLEQQRRDRDRCIIFVDRVYMAAFLTQVLSHRLPKSIRIKYLAGSKVQTDGISQSPRYQREMMKEFRNKDIDVLVATAIIEEGLDVADCNLVIRFNKPQNFSSYMQSKGRARAKANACYVILRDEADMDEWSANNHEYKDYEHMAKILQRNFQTTVDTDASTDDMEISERFYTPSSRVKIDGIRAMQIISQYCGILGQGQRLSPRFLYYKTESDLFKCVLTMPDNCPIRDDLPGVDRNKKRAKFECCLSMVERLHKIGELDDACLPIRPERSLIEDDDDDDSNDERPTDVPMEAIEKEFNYFMHETSPLSNHWYVYRIQISNDEELGFLVPCQLKKLPPFTLYGREGHFTVDIVYVKSLDWTAHRTQLEQFNRYLFEHVFEKMGTGDNASLQFNMAQSKFKLLPCLLTRSNDIDWMRMATICSRRDKSLQSPSELDEKELYYATPREYLVYVGHPSLSKKASDAWEHKKSVDTIKTYADHFEYKNAGLRVRRDFQMGTMKVTKRPRLNYLKVPPALNRKETIALNQTETYYPIEVLRYASLNRADFDLIHKLPSVLLRLTQLYHAQRLQQLFGENIRCYSPLDNHKTTPITFADCMRNAFSTTGSCPLPLACLRYDHPSGELAASQTSLGLIFQALTRRSADEATDMENLEILGDCFLKLSTSMSFFHQYPNESAGKLTMKKDRQVSNANLYRLASQKDLKRFLYVDRVVFEGTDNNWIPPGYALPTAAAEKYTHQKAKRKAFADMIEGLIGAFLIATDYTTTRQMMQWLGLNVIPVDEHGRMMATPSILFSNQSDPNHQERVLISQLYSEKGLDRIEQEINYVFKNKAYLISAFTHPSYMNNRLTHCYERLEYLGDAVLDFLVIRCIFVDHYERVKPSHVTDIRQDLANNGRLAYLLGCCGLHKYILHASPYLFDQITSYSNDETIFPSNLASKEKLKKDINQWADSTAPKAMADVFEALVGAIFIDSGYSLDTVWKVVHPRLQSYIEESTVHTNINPIRCFHEQHGNVITTIEDGQGKFVCTVQTRDGQQFVGHGKSTKLAKYDACRKAMKN